MSLTINLSVAVIDKTRNFFERAVGNSGIWGLGFSSLNRRSVSPLFDDLLRGGQVDDDSFSLALCGSEGHLWLGHIPKDEKYYHGELQYVPMLHTPRGLVHYQVALTDISIAGQPLRLSLDDAIVDSGTTFLILPPTAYSRVINALRSYMPDVDEVGEKLMQLVLILHRRYGISIACKQIRLDGPRSRSS